MNNQEEKDDEIEFYGEPTSKEDEEFDNIVGQLEEIIYSSEFVDTQTRFLNDHCDKFSEMDSENKLEHTEIFQQYTIIIENLLTSMLKAKIPGFELNRFEAMLVSRKDEIDQEIFNVMLSIGNFMDFIELIISHKKSTEESKTGESVELDILGKKI